MDLMTRRMALMAQSAQEAAVLATATGNPMTFTTDLARRLHSLVIPFSPVQADGTPSPDNLLPISGWTGANIKQKGKNLLDISNGTEILASWTRVGSEYQFVLSGLDTSKDYTLSVDITTTLGASGARRLYFYGSDSGSGFIETGTSGHKSLTKKPNTDGTLKITQNATAFNTSGYAEALTKMQLEVGSTMTAFEAPKAGNTLPINWQSSIGTIYGGTVTLNEDRSADVVSTHLFTVLDGSSDEELTSGSSGAQVRWYPPSAIRTIIKYPSTSSTTNSFANYLNVLSQAASWTNNMFSMASNAYIYMRCDTIGALANWRPYLAEHPLQFCFELKNTAYTTYHFSNIGQLVTFLGTNTIWTDTNGTNTAEYYKKQ